MSARTGGTTQRYNVAPRLEAAPAASVARVVGRGGGEERGRVWPTDRTGGHAASGHHGRLAPPPPGTAGHDGPWVGGAGTPRPCGQHGRAPRAFGPTGHGTAGHHGPTTVRAGTPPLGTMGHGWDACSATGGHRCGHVPPRVLQIGGTAPPNDQAHPPPEAGATGGTIKAQAVGGRVSLIVGPLLGSYAPSFWLITPVARNVARAN